MEDTYLGLVTDALRGILCDGQPRSEFQLVQSLQSATSQLLATEALADNVKMFQTHFLVQHCLYRLQAEFLAESGRYLDISALSVQLQPSSDNSLQTERDIKLSVYYGDWQNFSEATEQDIEALLDSFWQRMSRLTAPAQELVEQSLAVLDLGPGAGWEVVKSKYKKALHQVHPDKGGCSEQTQAIVQAYNTLKQHYLTQV